MICKRCKKDQPDDQFYVYQKANGRVVLLNCQDCRLKNKQVYKKHNISKDNVLFREFSGDTDMMLVIMTNEGSKPYKIAEVLNRDQEMVEARIKDLRELGKFQRIHERLMKRNGVYALNMRRSRCNY